MATLTLTPMIHTIAVEYFWDSEPSTFDVQYKKSSEGTWRTFFPDGVVKHAVADNAIKCVLQCLAENTAYDVRVTNMDTDTTASGSATTEQDALPNISSTVVHVNHATGNDTTGDGSAGTPWATIQHAVDNTAGPAVVETHGNGSETDIVVPSTFGGTSGEWSAIRNASGETSTIDVGGGSNQIAVRQDCDYLIMYDPDEGLGLEFSNAEESCLGSNENDTDTIGMRYRYIKVTDPGATASDSEAAGIHWRQCSDVRVEHCTITNSNAGNLKIVFGTFWRLFAGTIIIHNCLVQASGTNRGKDGIGGNGADADADGPFKYGEIFSNVVTGWLDDGIEAEGNSELVSIFGNTIRDCFIGAALNQINVGPCYVHHNVFDDNGVQASVSGVFKLGTDDAGARDEGDLFLLHNTAYYPTANRGGGFLDDEQNTYTRHYVKNNAMYIGDVCVYANYQSTAGEGNSYDYNDQDAHDGASQAGWRWHDGASYTSHNSFAAWQADAQADQADVGVNSIASDPSFVDAGNDDFTPDTGSPLIDAGLAMVGINTSLDSFTAWEAQGDAPDIGAIESEAVEVDLGQVGSVTGAATGAVSGSATAVMATS